MKKIAIKFEGTGEEIMEYVLNLFSKRFNKLTEKEIKMAAGIYANFNLIDDRAALGDILGESPASIGTYVMKLKKKGVLVSDGDKISFEPEILSKLDGETSIAVLFLLEKTEITASDFDTTGMEEVEQWQ
jgi:hypothetical protein